MSCLCMPRLETHVKIAGFCVEHSDGKTFSHSHLRRRVGSGTTQRCPLSVHYIYHIRYSRHLGIYTRYSKLTNHKAYKHLQNLQKHQVFKEGFRAPLRGRGHGRGWVLWSAGRSCCFGEGLRRGQLVHPGFCCHVWRFDATICKKNEAAKTAKISGMSKINACCLVRLFYD